MATRCCPASTDRLPSRSSFRRGRGLCTESRRVGEHHLPAAWAAKFGWEVATEVRGGGPRTGSRRNLSSEHVAAPPPNCRVVAMEITNGPERCHAAHPPPRDVPMGQPGKAFALASHPRPLNSPRSAQCRPTSFDAIQEIPGRTTRRPRTTGHLPDPLLHGCAAGATRSPH
jgi:hypothetical protein